MDDGGSVNGLSGGRKPIVHSEDTPTTETVALSVLEHAAEWARRFPSQSQVDAVKREADRLAFLRRVQHVDPRERRA